MNVHVVYDPKTGVIRSRRTGFGLPPEGPVPYGEGLHILHVDAHPNLHRIEDGKVVDIAKDVLDKAADEKLWMAFKRKRAHILTHNEFRLMPHYPTPDLEREELLGKYQQSRDIPNHTEDPTEAMAMLDQIWSTKDVE